MKQKTALMICLTGWTVMASNLILTTAVDARGGRGGGRGGGGGFNRGGGGSFSRGGGSMGGGSWGARPSRPSNGPSFRGGSRSSINQNIAGNRGNYGGNRGNYGANRGNYGGNRVSQPIAGRGNGNFSGNGNFNGNRNTNINRNINIDNDWDGRWGGGYGGYYRPGAGLVAGAVVGAAVSAAVVGSYYASLPPNCVSVYRMSTPYYQCGSVWYQPTYSGTSIQYVVVNAP